MEHLPAQQARPYSISSWSESGLAYDIVFSLVDIPQGDVRRFPRKGISTGWLKEFCDSKKTDAKLLLYKRIKKLFAPPSNLDKSFIMVGVGTGVAPFRGFLQKRNYDIAKQSNVIGDIANSGKTWLIFGCRDRNLDSIYREEMITFNQNKILTRFDCAFSRENTEIKYVQDVIKANAKDIAKCIVDDNAIIYVCGDALNMAKDVLEAIVHALTTESQISESDARKKIADMRLNDEYLQDLWT